jgi:hypothetical protein
MRALYGLALLPLLALGQTVTVPRVGQSPILSWERPQLNEDGSALTDLRGYEIAITPPGANLQPSTTPSSGLQFLDSSAALELDLGQLLGPLQSGLYKAWIRAVDTAGNRSRWSSPLDFEYDRLAPAAPTLRGIRVRITVDVGG